MKTFILPHSFHIRFFRITNIDTLAIPSPLRMPQHSLFLNNLQSTINNRNGCIRSSFRFQETNRLPAMINLEIKWLVQNGNEIPLSESIRPGKIQTSMQTSNHPCFQATE